MTNEALIEAIVSMETAAETRQGIQYVETTIPADRLHKFMTLLKNDNNLAFDFLICLTGVDQADHMQVVYHMESTLHRHFLVVRVKTADRTTPVIDTVSDIWPTAEFHEREAFDLVGIRFNNHPDLRRLFLDDTWGFPLRKDFKDDVHIVSR